MLYVIWTGYYDLRQRIMPKTVVNKTLSFSLQNDLEALILTAKYMYLDSEKSKPVIMAFNKQYLLQDVIFLGMIAV